MDDSRTSTDLAGAERRSSGFGGYLKRFRTAIKKQPSTKSMKVRPNDSAASTSARPPELLGSKSPAPQNEDEVKPYMKNNVAESNGSPDASEPSQENAEDSRVKDSIAEAVPTGEHKTEETSFVERYKSRLEEEDRLLYSENLTAERISKNPQMRVHHYCHKCQSTLTSDGLCGNCRHRRCAKCMRVPTKRAKSGDHVPFQDPSASPVQSSNVNISNVAMFSYRPKELPDTAVLSRLQKVRWICHHCQAFFILDERECQDCGHFKCTKCTRYPPRTSSGDGGGPPRYGASLGDHQEPQMRERTYKRPRIRVKYWCENCDTLFVEHSKACERCGHIRCSNCPRQPPRRGEFKGADPEVLKVVEHRLAGYALMEQPGQRHAVNDIAA